MVLGASIGALGSIAGGLLSNSLSTYQMQQMADYTAALNYSYAKKSAKNMPTYNRYGLEKAGYNPMLALSNLSGAQTNWSQLANPTTPDLSGIGNDAVSNALAVKQQDNQNRLTTAQEENYNADTVLKREQAASQSVERILKNAEADYNSAKAELTRKDISNYERQQAREDLRVNGYLQSIANDYKIQTVRNAIDSSNAVSNRINANSNANSQAEITNLNRIERRKKEAYYSGNTSKLSRRQRFQQSLYNVGQGISDFTGFGRVMFKH